MSTDLPRVLIVAEHASARFGGEAILPLHWFRLLRRRGAEVFLVVHARTRDELALALGPDADRICFVPDTWLHKLLWRLGSLLPDRLNLVTLGFVSHVYTQASARRLARRIVREQRIDVVHQPIPVSPREPSLLFGLGAPLVIGPMNGGMFLPPGFRDLESFSERLGSGLAKLAANAMNALLPGKRRAFALLVANARTRSALPAGTCSNAIELVENGVDLSLWSRPREAAPSRSASTVRFAFVGRLVALKAVDVLLEALADARRETAGAPSIELDVLGDGPERANLERRARDLGLGGAVRFHGWLEQPEAARRLAECDALAMPSVRECGGAVVLEAMALGLPVVATDWGGPADYLDASSGVLVPVDAPPGGRHGLRAGFARALVGLARDPELRARLGRAGRARVEAEFDWERKVDALLPVYRAAAASRTGSRAGSSASGSIG